MIKILFLINTLGGGGAERALVNLITNMDRSEFAITVKTMFDGGVNTALLCDNVNYVNKKAPCPRGIAYFFKLIPSRLLYSYFVSGEKYDILVAFMHGAPVKVICGCKEKNTKTIGWLHNGNPETGTFFRFWFTKRQAFKAYSALDKLVGVSDNVSKKFSDYTGIKNISTVYNTNDVKKIRDGASEKFSLPFDKKGPLICSVGRLVKEKGFERLISAVVRLRSEVPGIELMIIGDGEEAGRLNSLINGYGAGEYIHLVGFDINPYKYMIRSDYFACSSYTEGLSTALTEAVILGMPCVSTDVSGAKEILGENNEFGIVTENSEQGIYEGMKRLLEDEKIAEHYRKKAEERAAFFDTENTVKQAEDLFLSLMN